MERRIFSCLLGDEIEEVPLRHQRDVLGAGRQVGEVGEGVFLVAEECADRLRLLVRQREELVEQAELVHQLQRGGMNGIAAEIAEEVGMLLQHDDVDAGARQQKAEHEPARPAADDATARGELLGCHSCFLR